jgi:hypothetical protein
MREWHDTIVLGMHRGVCASRDAEIRLPLRPTNRPTNERNLRPIKELAKHKQIVKAWRISTYETR